MLRRTRPTRERPGLTLLEVILSLAIFLFSLVAIGHLMTVGAQRAADVRSQGRATQLAQSKLNEVLAGVLPLSGGEGNFDEDPDYTWSVQCQQENIPNLWDVSVKVERTNREGIHVVLQQVIVDPTARGSASDATVSTDTGTPSSSATASASGQTGSGATGAGATGAGAVSGGAMGATASKTGAASTPAASSSRTTTTTPAASGTRTTGGSSKGG